MGRLCGKQDDREARSAKPGDPLGKVSISDCLLVDFDLSDVVGFCLEEAMNNRLCRLTTG